MSVCVFVLGLSYANRTELVDEGVGVDVCVRVCADRMKLLINKYNESQFGVNREKKKQKTKEEKTKSEQQYCKCFPNGVDLECFTATGNLSTQLFYLQNILAFAHRKK